MTELEMLTSIRDVLLWIEGGLFAIIGMKIYDIIFR